MEINSDFVDDIYLGVSVKPSCQCKTQYAIFYINRYNELEYLVEFDICNIMVLDEDLSRLMLLIETTLHGCSEKLYHSLSFVMLVVHKRLGEMSN